MEFNIEPYNDDFEINAKDNNYLKILFKPGYSVQARELTQIQSILQNQIKSLGDHIFQDGSPVIGGNIALDNQCTYIKLDETYANEDIELDLFVGKVILRDGDALVQAKVLAQYYPSGGTPTLLIKYLTGIPFTESDIIKIAGTTTRAKLISEGPATGFGTIASINDGIFYVDGYFVTITEQTSVVSAYSQSANVKIGLEVNDDVIDYGVDSTLLDPAQGSFNYQAPGADRYQFSLSLSTRPLETSVDESQFFELMRLENGAITKQVKYPIYSEIEKTLARRTFDESGDYTVRPFRASISSSPNTDNYMITIEPGKAYVKGFEFETIGNFRMEAPKPRVDGVDTRSLVDIDCSTSYGNYLKFKNLWGSNTAAFLDTDNEELIDLHCTDTSNVNIGLVLAANTTFYANTKIGTARVRNIGRAVPSFDDNTNDSNGVFDIYLTDINITPRVFKVDSGTSNTVVLPEYASLASNAYQNTFITILPIDLIPVAAVTTANVFQYSVRVNANSVTLNTFTVGNVSAGDIVRVGDETKTVVTVSTDGDGDYLLCSSPFQKTIDGTPLSVFKQYDYSSNVTNQTRFVERYDGPTQTLYLNKPFDENSVPTSNSIVQLNFGLRDLKSFVETGGVSANAYANVSYQSLLENGDTELFDADNKTLIFRLPKNTVKRGSLNNVDFNHTKVTELIGSGGVFTLGVAAYESIPWAITNTNIENNLIAVVRESSTVANGSIYKLTTSEVSPSGGGLQITLPSTVAKIDVYCTVKINDAEDQLRRREKTFRSNTSITTSPFNYPTPAGVTLEHTVTINSVDSVKINVASGLIFITDPAYTNIFPGESLSLWVPDVVKVRKILSGNTTHPADADNFEDITSHFMVDYGQRDEMYDHAKLTLKQGYPSPNKQLTIHCDFFTHTHPTGATFFSVDSYEDEVYQNGTIPVFSSDLTGIYYLRDCLDFRATRRIASNAVDRGILPDPNSSTELSVDYYLPRVDKLVLSKNKEFRIIRGVSSPDPAPPSDSDEALTLYTIYLPPFVSRISDIRLRYNESRRYTMKDIAQIDKRLQSIEYYTALNNIENMAFNDEAKYEDGTDKAKFGVIGEGFKNFNIADYTNDDFGVSMKPGKLTPYIRHKFYDMKLISNSNLKENKSTVTLNYTETPMVTQDVTSSKAVSVQPFLFAQFIGQISLSPSVDYWVSTTLKPEILRAPEIDGRIREIIAAEVVVDHIDEPVVTVYVPPTTNANSVIITTPGSDPEVSDPADEPPMAQEAPPVVIEVPPKTPEAIVIPPKEFPVDVIETVLPVVPTPLPTAPISIQQTSPALRAIREK